MPGRRIHVSQLGQYLANSLRNKINEKKTYPLACRMAPWCGNCPKSPGRTCGQVDRWGPHAPPIRSNRGSSTRRGAPAGPPVLYYLWAFCIRIIYFFSIFWRLSGSFLSALAPRTVAIQSSSLFHFFCVIDFYGDFCVLVGMWQVCGNNKNYIIDLVTRPERQRIGQTFQPTAERDPEKKQYL